MRKNSGKRYFQEMKSEIVMFKKLDILNITMGQPVKKPQGSLENLSLGTSNQKKFQTNLKLFHCLSDFGVQKPKRMQLRVSERALRLSLGTV